MLTQEAINTLANSGQIHQAEDAIKAALKREKQAVVALPDSFKVSDLEKFQPTRRRLCGTLSTSNEQHFVSYCRQNKEAGAIVAIDADEMQAVAHLNFGTAEAPGHADNIAKLHYQRTAEYRALLRIEDLDLSQRELAEFLEDFSHHIKCFDDAGGEITLGHAVAAVRKVTIESLSNTDSEVSSLQESRSTFESIKASSKQPLPVRISFTCTPYFGLPERQFNCRLTVAAGEKAPRMGLKLVHRELHKQEMAEQAVQQLHAALDSEMPVYVGSYKVKQ